MCSECEAVMSEGCASVVCNEVEVVVCESAALD